MTDHVILCGLGELGFRTLERLRAFGETVVVMDPAPDPAFAARCAEWGVIVVRGSGRDPRALREAGVLVARAVIVVAADDMINLAIALAAREENPDLRLVVRLFNERLVSNVERQLPRCRVLDVAALAAPIFAYAGLHADVLHALDVPGGRFLLRAWRGRTAPEDARLIAMRRERRGDFGGGDGLGFTLTARPDWDTLPFAEPAGAGDEVFGFMRADDAEMPAGGGRLARGRLKGWRRFGRDLARRFRSLGQDASLLIFALLVLVVLVGVETFHQGMGLSWLHSVYFVITVVTTTGFGDITPKDAPAPMIWAAVGLMVFGSLVMAAVSAWMTEKLLALRMGGIFNRRPLPERGHFIIGGLGTVGYRIAEELAAAGHPCVALEKEENSRLVERVRRLGVPVVVSTDIYAAMADVYVEDARAIIAVTNDDAVNLELALMAQEANPSATIVARVFDPALASHLERSFGIHLARSPSAIAAPAFAVAAAAGDLLDAFDLGETLYCVGAVNVAAGHRLAGTRLDELGQHEMLVLSWRRGGGEWSTTLPPLHRLEEGDEIVIVTPRERWLMLYDARPAAVRPAG